MQRNHNANIDYPASVYLAAIVMDNTFSWLRLVALYTNARSPDAAHQTFETESVAEYAYTTASPSNCFAGEKAGIVPSTFNEAMSLPAQEPSKVDNVYTLRSTTFVPSGNEVIDSRWVY